MEKAPAPQVKRESLRSLWDRLVGVALGRGDLYVAHQPRSYLRALGGGEELARVVYRTSAGEFLLVWLETGRGGVIGEYLATPPSWRALAPDELARALSDLQARNVER